jgi:hypothetical protein
MPLELSIADDDVQYLNEPAKNQLLSSCRRYIEELLREAGRLEADQNTTGGDPEITSSMINHAETVLRRAFVRPKKLPWIIACQIGAVVFSLLAGLLLDLEILKKPIWLVALIIVLVIAITCTVLVTIKE